MRIYKNLIARILASLLMAFALQAAYAEQPKVILVTGFEPFGGGRVNASWEAVQNLDGKRLGNVTVVVAQLPVVWGKAEEKLQTLISVNKPVAVISFGEAGGGPVRLEAIAHNVRGNIRDNNWRMPPTSQVYQSAASTLKTGLPLSEIETRLRTAGIPVNVSEDAGNYLCNDIFYTLMYDPGTENAKKIPRGFVHVPLLNAKARGEEANIVTFDKKLLQKAAEIIVQAVADTLIKN